MQFDELNDTALQKQSKFVKMISDWPASYPTMVIDFITRDEDDDVDIPYVSSNETTSLSAELDALNNRDISCAKDFLLYIEIQLEIVRDFLDLEKRYQVLLQVKFFTHSLI